MTTTPRRTRLHPLYALAGAGLLAWFVGENFKDTVWYNLFPKRFGQVVEGEVYRSGKLTPAAMRQVVERHDIRTIVDLGAWPEGSRADLRAARTAEALGVDRLRMPHLEGDSRGEINGYVRALEIINDPDRRPVLVHCGAGTERTGCVVALYRMFEEGWSMDEAYAEADRAGHSPRRNPKLKRTLDLYTDAIREALETGRPVELDAEDAAVVAGEG